MRRRVLVLPELRARQDVAPLLHRLGFSLAHVDPESVTLLVHPEARREYRAVLAGPAPLPDLDPVTAERLRAMAGRFRLARADDPDELVDGADLVLVWDTSRARAWDAALARRTQNLTAVAADVHMPAHEAGQLAAATHRLSPTRQSDASESRQRLAQLVADLGCARTAYLVASGPSARQALQMDLSDGVRIACGGVVLDDELMRHVRPHVVTFADPVRQGGPSADAGRFRAALSAAAAEHDFSVVVADRDSGLLASLRPELEPRIVGIPLGGDNTPVNLDLSAFPVVKPWPSVLTTLMMPLAATLADDVRLIGFDTSDADDGEHLQVVESCASGAEELGKRVYSLTPSQMPPLRRRSLTDDLLPVRPCLPALRGQEVVVSVEPDWVSDFGHYRLLNTLMHRLVTDEGRDFVALTSRGLDVGADWQRPTFTHPTSRSRAAPVHSATFRDELAAALRELAGSSSRVTAVMYTADLWHLPALLGTAAGSRGDLRFVVNLMRAHGDIVAAATGPRPHRSWAGTLLREAHELAGTLGVTLTVDTEDLNDYVETLIGDRLVVWPMAALQHPCPSGEAVSSRSGRVRVHSPVRASPGRGFCEFAALASVFSEAPDSADFELVARYERQPGGSPPAVDRALADLRSAEATVLYGPADDGEYLAELGRADVVVVPYHLHEFRTRTSAVLLDAVLAGKPVVVTAGTWMARVVERYGVGETFADQDVADLERAVRLVAQRLDKATARVAEVREEFAAEFSPARLSRLLADPPAGARTHDPARDGRVRSLELFADSMFDRTLEHHRSLARARSAQSARELHHICVQEAQALRVDELTRAVRQQARRLLATEREMKDVSAERGRLAQQRDALDREVRQRRRVARRTPAACLRRLVRRVVRRPAARGRPSR